jgi:hypothetical protein
MLYSHMLQPLRDNPQAIKIRKCKAVIVTSVMVGQMDISVIVFMVHM